QEWPGPVNPGPRNDHQPWHERAAPHCGQSQRAYGCRLRTPRRIQPARVLQPQWPGVCAAHILLWWTQIRLRVSQLRLGRSPVLRICSGLLLWPRLLWMGLQSMASARLLRRLGLGGTTLVWLLWRVLCTLSGLSERRVLADGLLRRGQFAGSLRCGPAIGRRQRKRRAASSAV